METHIYFYLIDGKWHPFSLPEEYSKAWNGFCQEIMLLRRGNPNPDYDDYMNFLELIKNDRKK